MWQDGEVKELQATIEQGEQHIAGLTAQLQVLDLPTSYMEAALMSSHLYDNINCTDCTGDFGWNLYS